ncbi:hypothetical protein [Piscinibacter sp.]|jgi:hypothetical protein|uniref:hypothetical protein n=1 Tax=Piscinibacter sp. TaxID=1903157 RepID=UPI00355A9654
MEPKTFDDLIKLQHEFSATLASQLKTLASTRPSTPDELLAEKRALLKQSRTTLESVVHAKEQAIKRFDLELARHQDSIARLERDLGEFDLSKRESAKAEAAKPKTPKPAAKRKPTGARR